MISCVFNCFPVDTGRRTIFRAMLRPYTPGQVTWQPFLENSLVDEAGGKLDLFNDSTASRILRIDGPRLERRGHLSSNVLVKVESKSLGNDTSRSLDFTFSK